MDDGFDPAGIAAFAAAVCGVAALACTRSDQWGIRRLTLGAGAASGAIAGLLLSPSVWWWSGILWGLHQMYLGWSYVARRRRITHERAEYLESSAAVLAYIALADGSVDPREAEIIRATYARAGFSADDLREVDRVVRECQHRFFADGSDPERLFVLLRQACTVVVQHSNAQTRLSFLRAAILIAMSDGFLGSAEERLLRAIANWLGIEQTEYDHLWQGVNDREAAATVPPDLATHYASILGVPVTASPQDLKRAYREKAKQYHPDVVAHKSPVFAHEAEERFKELSRAYQFLRGDAMIESA
jgi:DnaJ like chaperone protein